LTEPQLPPFRPRGPWWGADLQTLRNALRRDQRDEVSGERLLLRLSDRSCLAARLDRPIVERAKPLVVVIHGLAGSETSFYMVATARHLVEAGFPVLRLNLRGAGASKGLGHGHYHAGKTEDIADALSSLPGALSANGLLLLGFSLGGNMLLKLLGEGNTTAPILAAATVSAPIDLAATARRMLALRNRVYHRRIVRHLKDDLLAEDSDLTPPERRAVERARSVMDLDNDYIAPRYGFADAWDYYAQNSAAGFLPKIRHKTLIVHAFDDPWIPAESYRRIDWSVYPLLSTALTRKGGHVGFHGTDSLVPWHDRVVAAFFAIQAG